MGYGMVTESLTMGMRAGAWIDTSNCDEIPTWSEEALSAARVMLQQ
jgi:hypothetical protein